MASEQRRQDERRVRTATRWLAAGSIAATTAFGGLAAAASHGAGASTTHSDSSTPSTPSDTFTPQQSFAPPVAQSGGS